MQPGAKGKHLRPSGTVIAQRIFPCAQPPLQTGVATTARELYEAINHKYALATAVERMEASLSERLIKAIARNINRNISDIDDYRHGQVVIRGAEHSHSFTLVCCGAIPIGSSLVVGFVHLAAESLRVSSRRRLGQTLGQIRKAI